MKHIIINAESGKLIWRENVADVDKITVSQDCTACYFVDGTLERELMSGEKMNLNNLFSRNNSSGRELLCGNTRGIFTTDWGIGDIPFKDKESGLATKIGMNGEFKFRVNNIQTLAGSFSERNLGINDVQNFACGKLTEIAKAILATTTEFSSYLTINRNLTIMSNSIKEKFKDTLIKIGIVLSDFVIKSVYFDENFVERYEEHSSNNPSIEQRLQEERKKKRERIQRMEDMKELERIQEIADDFSEVTSQGSEKTSANCCKHCGRKLNDKEIFCSKCGRKI